MLSIRSQGNSLPGLIAVIYGLLCTPLAQAEVLFRFVMVPRTGDTLSLAGITDAGDYWIYGGQLTGNCSGTQVFNGGGGAVPGVVAGLPRPDSPECSVAVADINSAGDMIGTSFTDTATPVATFWRLGVAYDMTDPANAGLVFVPDAGVRYRFFDFDAMGLLDRIVDVPPDFPTYLQLDMFTGSRSLLSNSNGMMAFSGYSTPYRADFLLVPFQIAEPMSLELCSAALLCVAIARRRRRRVDSAST